MKFQTLKFMSAIFFLSLLLYACEKESAILGQNLESVESRKGRPAANCGYDLSTMDTREQLSILFSEFVAKNLRDEGFKSYLFDQLLNGRGNDESKSTNDLFIINTLNDQVNFASGTSTVELAFESWLNSNYSAYLDVLNSICSENEDLVLSLPWWFKDVLSRKLLSDFKFCSQPAIDPILCDGKKVRVSYTEDGQALTYVMKNPLRTYVPIFVKPGESILPIDMGNGELSNGMNLNDIIAETDLLYKSCDFSQYDINDFIETLDCSGSTIINLGKVKEFIHAHCSFFTDEICDNGIDDDGDNLIDGDDPDCQEESVEICDNGIDDDGDNLIDGDDPDCIEGEICDNEIDDDGDGLIDGYDPDCPCLDICQRDCNQDDNFLVGLKFSDAGYAKCVVPEESLIDLVYTFVGVRVCQPDFNSDECSPEYTAVDVEFTLTDWVTDFFEVQTFEVHEDDDDEEYYPQLGQNGVVFIGETNDDGWIEYLKAYPKYYTTMFPYIRTLPDWNGDLIGNYIYLNVKEIDNASIVSTVSNSHTVNVSKTANAGLNMGLDLFDFATTVVNVGFSFSTSTTNTETASLRTTYDKEVILDNYILDYCDKDEILPDPSGVQGNTWYGHIPNNYPGQILFQEFRVDL